MHIHHEEDNPPLLPYLIISILLHILLIAFFPTKFVAPIWKEKMVEVIPIFEKNQKYELADIDRPSVEKRPKKAKFLGMYDSSVEQETVAASRSQKQEARSKKQEAKKQRAEEKTEEAKKPSGQEVEKMTIGKSKSLYSLERKLFAKKTPDIESRGTDGATAALQDYYPDYRLGVHTYLNVLRYPDVEYFVRMKRQFKMTFNPIPPLQHYFSMNRVARGNVEVVLAVSVSRDGNLSELFVINTSGIPAYDQEAMRTIKASAPFASPPGKFLEDDGMLRMSWTFTVYL